MIPPLVSRPSIMPVACRQREEGSGLEKRTGPVSILPEAESDAAGDDRHGFGVRMAMRRYEVVGREFHAHDVPIACRRQDSKFADWRKVADIPPFQISHCHDRRCLDVLLRRKRSGAAAGRSGFARLDRSYRPWERARASCETANTRAHSIRNEMNAPVRTRSRQFALSLWVDLWVASRLLRPNRGKSTG
jgi:hypothetical protein